VVEQFTRCALDQDGSIEHGANIECDNKVVCNSHVHLLVLNLELVGLSSLLNVVLDYLGDTSQDNEILSQLLRLDW